MISLNACVGMEGRLDAAATVQGELEASRTLPDLHADCERVSRSSVERGDRLDTALLKTDAALARQNARTRRCAEWYAEVQEGFAGDQPAGPVQPAAGVDNGGA